jgi:DNA-binding NarL/FixJ family response regulator
MKVAIVHSHEPTAQVLVRAISSRLHIEVITFSCIENVLMSSMDYDIFIVYNNFGHKMTGVRGVTLIRDRKPRAFIVGVSYKPNFERQFLPAGANAFILRAGNEVEELVTLVQKHLSTRPTPRPVKPTADQPQYQSERQAPVSDSSSLPKLLVTDTSNLDPVGRQAIQKLIAQLKRDQRAGQ